VETIQTRTSQLLITRDKPKGTCPSSSAARFSILVFSKIQMSIFSVHAVCIFFKSAEANGAADSIRGIKYIIVPLLVQLPALLDVRPTSLDLL
jgi:hypothetical protein